MDVTIHLNLFKFTHQSIKRIDKYTGFKLSYNQNNFVNSNPMAWISHGNKVIQFWEHSIYSTKELALGRVEAECPRWEGRERLQGKKKWK